MIGANHGPAISKGKRSTIRYGPRQRAPRSPRSCSAKPFFNVPKTKTLVMAGVTGGITGRALLIERLAQPGGELGAAIGLGDRRELAGEAALGHLLRRVAGGEEDGQAGMQAAHLAGELDAA